MPELLQYIIQSDKPKQLQKLINEALYILSKFGIPVEGMSKRRMERVAMAFLAVANVKTETDWANIDSSHALRTRDIIRYWNSHFYEKISESSYDDIRRKDLKLIVLAGIIIASSANPNAARNDGTRAFALSPEYAALIRIFRSSSWEAAVEDFLANKVTIEAYSEQRNWLYLIEAVHSSGAISPVRLLELKKLTEQCTADIIFVTAFLDRATFRQFAPDIAWETEVWIAEAPDHLIHFDGEKFLGPYSPRQSP